MNRIKSSRIGFTLGTTLLAALTGCVDHVEERHHARVYAPAPAYVERTVVVQDDYVYYPSYQVYYSGTTRQYVYVEGNSWVTRPAPPRVSADVLFASPSVRLDFHDAPAMHHAAVVQTYPRNWAPPGSGHGNQGGHNEGHKRDGKE